jgi:MoxR-like ATPase
MPELLPADILGISALDPHTQEFRFHPGTVFTVVLLADGRFQDNETGSN